MSPPPIPAQPAALLPPPRRHPTAPPLWRPDALPAGLRAAPGADWAATGVAIDSRDVIPGDLFLALPGTRSDGHDHVAGALLNGAVAALVHRVPSGLAADDPRLVFSSDTRLGLTALAEAARDRAPALRLAITGSAGKTGMCRLLQKALGLEAPTHASFRSFNNHVGVPLTLSRMPADSRYGVFELGMNNPGEIAPLSELVKPHLAMVTSVGPAHLGAFQDVVGIAREKGSIFKGLEPGGAAIVPLDSPYRAHLLASARTAGAGRLVTTSLTDTQADICALNTVWAADSTAMLVRVGEMRLLVKVGLPGKAWASNALLAIAAGHLLGADLMTVALVLEDLAADAGRGAQIALDVTGGQALLLDHSYNANPLSLKAALEGLAVAEKPAGSRHIAILADMLELGDDAREQHVGCAEAVRAARIDQIIAFGPHMAALAEATEVPFEQAGRVERWADMLLPRLRDGDRVLVMGANKAGLGRLVGALAAAAGRADPSGWWGAPPERKVHAL